MDTLQSLSCSVESWSRIYTGNLRNYNLIRHLRQTHQLFACEFCGQKFDVEQDWVKHLNIHLNRKPFEWKECGMNFRWSSWMKIHMNIHKRIRENSLKEKAEIPIYWTIQDEDEVPEISQDSCQTRQDESPTPIILLQVQQRSNSILEDTMNNFPSRKNAEKDISQNWDYTKKVLLQYKCRIRQMQLIYQRSVEIQQTKYYKIWEKRPTKIEEDVQRANSDQPAPSPISSNFITLVDPSELNNQYNLGKRSFNPDSGKVKDIQSIRDNIQTKECKTCKFKSKDAAGLQKHLAKGGCDIYNEGIWKICGKIWDPPFRVVMHTVNAHGKPFVCEFCCSNHQSFREIQKHYKIYHAEFYAQKKPGSHDLFYKINRQKQQAEELLPTLLDFDLF